jgi:hypothetical protein
MEKQKLLISLKNIRKKIRIEEGLIIGVDPERVIIKVTFYVPKLFETQDTH